jgi:ATPase subunit of ABC transporter with duplicated ATPase domains
MQTIEPKHNLIHLRDISFETKPGVFLFKNIALSLSKQKTGFVGKNGIGKTTLVRIITGEIVPFSGTVNNHARIAYLPQDYQLDLALSVRQTLQTSEEHTTLAALARVGLTHIKPGRLMGSLSGGERTRVALASLLIKDVNLMILDEPTNNLDYEARQAVYHLIQHWKGGLLVISHDRTLLGLMDSILELSDKGLKTYGGNYEMYMTQKRLEQEALLRQFSDAGREVKKIKRQAQATAERQQKRSSHGKKVAPDLGLPKAVLNEMRKHAQETSGKLKKIHEVRMNKASDKLKAARERISPDNMIDVDLSQTKIPNSKLVTEFKDVDFAYDQPVLNQFNLSLYGPERLAINGPNGSGKTTLIKLMLGKLQPSSGKIILGIERTAYLDQNVAVLDKAKTILENLQDLSNFDEKTARNWLALFLFPAEDVFKNVEILSGGERMRAALACILAGDTPPKLLILDEPTNNLDLNSIEQIESALLNFEGTLIVISHDKNFLKNIRIEREISL